MALRCAFPRDTAAETMKAARKQDPPELGDRACPLAPALERMVRRCLQKSPVRLTWLLAALPPTTLLPFAIPVSGEVSHRSLSTDRSMLAFVFPHEQDSW
jgi:hypothetical protein